MKRDMELCRKILLAIEEQKFATRNELTFNGYDQEAVIYHCRLLAEAGLIENVTEDLTGNISVGNLTWKGHDFLDKIREDTVWHKTKEIISQKGLPMMLKVIEPIASTIIEAMTEGAIKALKE